MSLFLTLLSVFYVSSTNIPDYKVFVTNNRYEADIWVWESKSKYESMGKEEWWFETKSKYESSVTIRYVKSKYQADLIIYFVDKKYQAGWKKEHPLKNNLIVPKK